MVRDLAIVGGGPAGVSAGIYAARKMMRTVIITDFFGGQSLVSESIHNWIGEKAISGFDLGKKLKEHLDDQKGVDVVEGDLAVGIKKKGEDFFTVTTEKGGLYEARTVLLATGSKRKKLGVPGEEKFRGRGVFYCSTCDAPLMGGMAAAVIGGGNSGLEGVVNLLPYASEIFLLHRRDILKGDAVTAERIKKEPKVKIIYNAEIGEVKGKDTVERLVYRDKKSGEMRSIPVRGVFVEIGTRPNSEIVSELVVLNERLEVAVDPKTQRSSLLGIWAAGDATDVLYKQNNISAGDAVKAVLNIHEYLQSRN